MAAPKPHVPTVGRVLEFDFPGLSIGVAEYEEGPTGCTVFVFDGAGLTFTADVRGGSTGNIGLQYGFAKAICFAGGSLMGLETASGVAAAVFAERGHEHVDWNDVPAVAGAIVFDYGRRRTGIYPDHELGAAAYRAAAPGASSSAGTALAPPPASASCWSTARPSGRRPGRGNQAGRRDEGGGVHRRECAWGHDPPQGTACGATWTRRRASDACRWKRPKAPRPAPATLRLRW